MQPVDLGTTNLLLGIMAGVAVLQALVLIGVAVAALRMYRQAMQTIADLETRQIAPLRDRVDSILIDVKGITARVSQQTERVDHAIVGTMDRVDETAERVKHSVRDKVAQATGFVRGVRAVIMSILGSDSGKTPPAEAAGRA